MKVAKKCILPDIIIEDARSIEPKIISCFLKELYDLCIPVINPYTIYTKQYVKEINSIFFICFNVFKQKLDNYNKNKSYCLSIWISYNCLNCKTGLGRLIFLVLIK